MPEAVSYSAKAGGVVQTFADGSLWVDMHGSKKALDAGKRATLREFFEWEKAREEERINPVFGNGEVWRIKYEDGTEVVAYIEVGDTGHVYLLNDYLNLYWGMGTRDDPIGREGIVSYERIKAA